jgi:hypothetical protein
MGLPQVEQNLFWGVVSVSGAIIGLDSGAGSACSNLNNGSGERGSAATKGNAFLHLGQFTVLPRMAAGSMSTSLLKPQCGQVMVQRLMFPPGMVKRIEQ